MSWRVSKGGAERRPEAGSYTAEDLAPSVIAVGDAAPEFHGTTGDGAALDLATYRGRRLVLYFFPKANTTGCTIETKGFAERYPELQRAGIDVVGVSVDSVEEQKDFATRCHAEFPLVADRDKAISRQYGVLGLLGFARRVTFFIGPDGRVEDVVEGLRPGPHVERAIERARSSTAPPASSYSRSK
jgi:thioredoxin-dependent peroxiredoxin